MAKKRTKRAKKAPKLAVAVAQPDISEPFGDFVPDREYVRGEFFRPMLGAKYRFDYDKLLWEAHYGLPQTHEGNQERLAIYQRFCTNDLFFLIYFGMNFQPINQPWLVERCKETEQNPDMTLSLWAREHFKCVDAKSLVRMSDGELKSAELVVPGDMVASYDRRGKAVSARVSAVENNGVKETLRIKTKSGKSITVTPNHRLMRELDFVEARDLRVGDWLTTGKTLKRKPIETMSLDEVRFLAYMVAEGSLSSGNCSFTNTDKEIIEDFQGICKRMGFQVRQYPCTITYGVGHGAREFLREQGVQGHKATEKRLPSELFHQPDEHLRAFLSVFIACDGTVNLHDNSVVVDLANPGLIDDLSAICLSLGIHVTRSGPYANNGAGAWHLKISTGDSLRKLPVLALREKQVKLNELISRKRWSNSDPIPTGMFRGLSTATRELRREGLRFNQKQYKYCPREKAVAIAEVVKDKELSTVLASDLGWEKIESIESAGAIPTIDIEVEGTQLFIVDGIVSHNTTIISIAYTIQCVFKFPEDANGIFSHSRPAAKSILRAIKAYLESDKLVNWFPHILWQDTSKAPSWGLETGLTVQRLSGRREATIEAWGLVDGMPTGMHYNRRVIDDLVDPDGVATPDQITKTREAFQQSHNLGSSTVPGARDERQVVGTPYSWADLYSELEKEGRYNISKHTVYGEKKSEYTAGRDGVLLTAKQIAKKLLDNGPYIFGCQQLMNPTPEKQQKVHADWIQYYQTPPSRNAMNVYIVGDPANTKKSKENHDPDYTSIWVFGACSRGFRYLLDGAYGRFSLVERWTILKGLVAKWDPKTVGWERYGKDTETDTFRLWMDEQNFRFDLIDLGGQMNKVNRINKWLIPRIFKKKWLLPTAIWVEDTDTNQMLNIVERLINDQVLPWPLVGHDDLFDNWSRAEDPELGVEEPYENQSMTKSQENAALAEIGKQYAEVPGL